MPGLLRVKADPFLRLLVGADPNIPHGAKSSRAVPVGCGLRMVDPLALEPRQAAQHIDRKTPRGGARINPLSDGDQSRDPDGGQRNAPAWVPAPPIAARAAPS